MAGPSATMILARFDDPRFHVIHYYTLAWLFLCSILLLTPPTLFYIFHILVKLSESFSWCLITSPEVARSNSIEITHSHASSFWRPILAIVKRMEESRGSTDAICSFYEDSLIYLRLPSDAGQTARVYFALLI